MPTTTIPDQDAVIAELDVNAPIERVFRALIDPAQLMRWWGQEGECKATVWEMDARVGGKWRFAASDSTGKIRVNGVSDFRAHGEILEFSPPRRIAYSWFANWHDRPEHPTVVTWDLAPAGQGTKVRVTHSGLAQLAVARREYAGGWPGVVNYLRTFVER